MALYPCKLWSADRLIKKTFMTSPSVVSVISEALSLGLHGFKLVLECDGSEICTDMVLEHYLKSNTILMLVENDKWTERITATSSNGLRTANVETNMNNTETHSTDILTNCEKSIPDEIIFEIDNNPSPELITINLDSTNVDSDATTTTSDTADSSKQFFENFQIPWQKIPSDILSLLNNQKHLGKRLNAFANLVIDELRISSSYIPMGVLRSITHKAIIKYPDSFLEKDNEGNVISTTTVPLLTMMRNRNNFLNRAPNCKSSENDPKIPLKHRRRSNLLKTTCSNWQPKNTNTTQETISSSEYKQKYMKNLYGKTVNSEEKQLLFTYMNDCFALQRTYFNCVQPVPTIENITNQWPYIFQRDYLYQHFKELMTLDPCSFINNFKNNQQETLRFFRNQNKIDLLDIDKSEDIIIVSTITKYFGDDLCYLQKNFKIGTSMDEIIEQIPRNTPFMAFVKCDIGQEKEKTYIFIEKVLVPHFVEENYNYLSSLNDVINYYYVFNIMYPKQLSQSMEFLLRLHYANSMRGPKKNINNIQKVNNLISKISKS